MTIRIETPADYTAVELLTRESFWNVHVPGCDEHYLVRIMRSAPEFLPALALVAERDGQIVGNIMYSKSAIVSDDGRRTETLTFGPLSVLPACQRQGIGKALMAESFCIAEALGYPAVLIYGDPENYKSSGFACCKHFGIHAGDGSFPVALLVRALRPNALDGISGGLQTADFYELDPAAAAAFESQFPPKERLEGLPSQLRFQSLLGAVAED